MEINTRNLEITTGLCAAALAKAATTELLTGLCDRSVKIRKNDGSSIEIPVVRVAHPEDDSLTEFYAIRERGELPDIVDRCTIHVTVKSISNFMEIPETAHLEVENQMINIEGGSGVGRITQKMPGFRAGQAAIDKDARNIIFKVINSVFATADVMRVLLVTISVKEGVLIASRTMSTANGYSNGIMIRGGNGSIDTVNRRQILDNIYDDINSMVSRDIKSIVVIPGSKSPDFAEKLTHISMKNAIRARNHIGESIDIAGALGVENYIIVGTAGKIIKLAAGIMNTHSMVADGKREIIALHLILNGGSTKQAREILATSTTDEAVRKLYDWNMIKPVIDSICNSVYEYMSHHIGKTNMKVGAIIVHREYGILGHTPDISNLLIKVSQAQFQLQLGR